MVISIVLTVLVLILSLITISKGYGYKHTVDPIQKEDDQDTQNNEEEK